MARAKAPLPVPLSMVGAKAKDPVLVAPASKDLLPVPVPAQPGSPSKAHTILMPPL